MNSEFEEHVTCLKIVIITSSYGSIIITKKAIRIVTILFFFAVVAYTRLADLNHIF